MSALTVYSLKTCDRCRAAIKALRAAGYELDIVDVRADGIKPAALDDLFARLGWETLLNKRSTSWRALDDDQTRDMDEKKAKALIEVHPTLLKRPVIIAGGLTAGGLTGDGNSGEERASAGWTGAQKALWL